jgi:hypothetical protein
MHVEHLRWRQISSSKQVSADVSTLSLETLGRQMDDLVAGKPFEQRPQSAGEGPAWVSGDLQRAALTQLDNARTGKRVLRRMAAPLTHAAKSTPASMISAQTNLVNRDGVPCLSVTIPETELPVSVCWYEIAIAVLVPESRPAPGLRYLDLPSVDPCITPQHACFEWPVFLPDSALVRSHSLNAGGGFQLTPDHLGANILIVVSSGD